MNKDWYQAIYTAIRDDGDKTAHIYLKSLKINPSRYYIYVKRNSKIFKDQLKEYSIGQSMSRRGNCLDNAPMESFFAHFKDEVHYSDCHSLEELELLVDDYMLYYNHQTKQ